MAIELKVSPDVLKSKSADIKSHIARFESYWNQMAQVVQNTKGYWVGEASNSHQKQFKDYEEDVKRIIKRLKEHPDDLLEMADIYEKTEEKAVQIVQSLPGDVII